MKIDNDNLLTKVHKIYKEVKVEGKNLTFPSIKETIANTIFIIFLSTILCFYFLFIGKIAMIFLKFIGA
jgi:hypothetical protein